MEKTTADRLREYLDIYNMTQSDLMRKLNIPKSTFSQYINGKRLPKQNVLTYMAERMNVSEAWLMGFDVPMENKIKFNIETDSEGHLMLIALYEELNEVNREKVISYMKYVLHEQKGNN